MDRFRRLWMNMLERWQPPEELTLMVTALLVGITTGMGAVIFRYLIRGVEWVGYQWIPDSTLDFGKSYVIAVPAIGGLLVGLLVYYFAREAKGHGVPEVMEAVALRGGRIRPIVAVVKSLASAISIGSGGSVGREGPIVQIGSALGSSVGQALKLSDDRVSNLVACGAAAGIAATFNAPIAGVIFALEVIMGGRFSVRYFSTVVVSAVAASVIGRIVFGDSPAFAIPYEYGIRSLWEFPLYIILGVLAAVVGVAYTRMIYASEDLFDRQKRLPEWFKPAIGGVLLGILALTYPLVTGISWTRTPQIFNVGYDVMESVLAGRLALSVVVILLVLKMLATTITLGSGGSGGVFAPALFIGSMLGAAFALSADHLLPGIVAPPGAYALVGMAAVFAACAHAPMTSILILFELTGDYRIILPLMLTVGVTTVLSRWMLGGESIYTLKLTRRGVRLRGGRDIDILQSVSVGEVMAEHVDTVPVDMTLDDLSEVFRESHRHGLIVMDRQGELWGIVTISDLDAALAENSPRNTAVADIGTSWPYLEVVFPNETIGNALAKMGTRGLGRLPVVSPEDPYRLLGVVRRADIIRAYNVALTRRNEIQHLTRESLAQAEEEMEFIDVFLSADDEIIGKALQEVAVSMPDDCIFVSIRRDGHVLVPHGNTRFEAGDQITAFVHRKDTEALFQCLHGAR